MVVEDVGFGGFGGGGVELEFCLGRFFSEGDVLQFCEGEFGVPVVRVAVREFSIGFFQGLVEFGNEFFFELSILGVCDEVVFLFDVGRSSVFGEAVEGVFSGGEVVVELEVAFANGGSQVVVREVPEEALAGGAFLVEDFVAFTHEEGGDVEATEESMFVRGDFAFGKLKDGGEEVELVDEGGGFFSGGNTGTGDDGGDANATFIDFLFPTFEGKVVGEDFLSS